MATKKEQTNEEWFLSLTEKQYTALCNTYVDQKMKLKIPKLDSYDQFLNYFKDLSPNKIKLLLKIGQETLSVEAYASIRLWADILANPSRISKIHKSGLTSATGEKSIVEIAKGDDILATLVAIRNKIAERIDGGSDDMARLTQQLRDITHQIADERRKLGPSKDSDLGKLLSGYKERSANGARRNSFKSRITVDDEKNKPGNQKPTFDQYKNGDIWIAEKTIELLGRYYEPLLDWQRMVLRRWLAVDEDGKWSNPECVLTVPRQNGKTFLIEARIIGGIVFRGEALMYTAQSLKTTDEIKRRVMNFFYNADKELNEMLTDEFKNKPKSLDYIELRNGGRCIFNTRTRTTGLGGTADTLLFDEAAELTDAQQEAMIPTLAAGKSQNHQTIYASMPPTSGSSGTVLSRIRRKVVDGKAPDVCMQEWGVKSITDVNDKDAWYLSNPSLGYFLMESAVAREAQTMSLDSFNSQRLGWRAGVESQ